VVANPHEPGDPGSNQDRGGQKGDPQRCHAVSPLQPQREGRRGDQADPDVPGQNARGQADSQDDSGTDPAAPAGPDRGLDGQQLGEKIKRLRLDRPPDPSPRPVQRQGQTQDQRRSGRVKLPEPALCQDDRRHRATCREDMGRRRAARDAPEQCQRRRIPRGEVGMPGRSRHVDLAITASRSQRRAEHGITRPIEPRRRRRVGAGTDRHRRGDGQQEVTSKR
jgi:hypothetical protein